MKLVKNFVVGIFCGSILAGFIYGISRAKHSPLFWVQSVEIQSATESQIEDSPVDQATLIQLVGISLNRTSLLDVDLKAVETRLLSHPWIREAKLQKEIPHRLRVVISFREPIALIQQSEGTLAYLDEEGTSFGSVNLHRFSDLPLLLGFSDQTLVRRQEALLLISRWENSPIRSVASLSSVHWQSERGFRVLAHYTILESPGESHTNAHGESRIRTMIDFGQGIDSDVESQLSRLFNVFRYLRRNAISVRQMWADQEKKIVVKIARNS